MKVPATAAARASVPADVEIIKDIEVGLSGSRMMHVDMARPVHLPPEPMPVLFIIHAGGWKDGTYHGGFGRGSLYSKGFTVVSIEYHPAGENARWPVQLMDCLRAVRWMRFNAAKYHVDPDRFAAEGDSAGAHLAACIAVYGDDPKYEEKESYPGVSARIEAVVSGDGPLDILSSENNHTNKYRWNIENLLGGTPAQRPESWNEACLVLHVRKTLPPFFIFHGESDPVVPIAESIHFVDALKQAGVPVEFIAVKNGGHDAFTPVVKNLPIEPSGASIVKRMTEFLEKYLSHQPLNNPHDVPADEQAR